MRDEERERLRRLQDRLLDRLRVVPRYRNLWREPLWPGGPSAEQLAELLWPEWEPNVEELLREVTESRSVRPD